jgi:hypothetical protein
MGCVVRSVVACAALAAGCTEPSGRAPQSWTSTIGSASDDGDEGETGLDIEPIDTSSTSFGGDEEEGGNEGFDCNGDDAQECDCLAEPGMGVQYCEDGVWGECMCDGSGSEGGDTTGVASAGESSDGGDEDPTGEPAPTEVCFLGADEAYTTCFPLHAFDPDAPPAGYEYPDALGGDPNYRRPVAFIDLEEIDGATYIAPNFRLDEIAQAFKGRWAIVQPHAIDSLQALRDAAGVLNVNSGYRSPAYNLEIGGATYSRHMYGDGFDLDPTTVTVDALEGLCEDHGGMLVEYETHVHCDWRFDDVDVEFFGPPGAAAPQVPAFSGRVEADGGRLFAPAEGFDEGEPVRRWTARDAKGDVVARAVGRSFVPPAGAVRVDVVIGARVEISLPLAPEH